MFFLLSKYDKLTVIWTDLGIVIAEDVIQAANKVGLQIPKEQEVQKHSIVIELADTEGNTYSLVGFQEITGPLVRGKKS